MPTKEQLRLATLTERGLTHTKDDNTGHFTLVDNAVDKTPLMLYTEGITGQRIEKILLMQMSTRRLAEWLSREIKRPVTQATIQQWRTRFKITRIDLRKLRKVG